PPVTTLSRSVQLLAVSPLEGCVHCNVKGPDVSSSSTMNELNNGLNDDLGDETELMECTIQKRKQKTEALLSFTTNEASVIEELEKSLDGILHDLSGLDFRSAFTAVKRPLVSGFI